MADLFKLLGCDTCAYCTGMLFGKHRLAPVLSPKKSVEGAVGGVVGAALLGLIYGAVFGGHMLEVENPMFSCALACAIAAVISQIGDLAALGGEAQPQCKGLRPSDPGTRRNPGPV